MGVNLSRPGCPYHLPNDPSLGASFRLKVASQLGSTLLHSPRRGTFNKICKGAIDKCAQECSYECWRAKTVIWATTIPEHIIWPIARSMLSFPGLSFQLPVQLQHLHLPFLLPRFSPLAVERARLCFLFSSHFQLLLSPLLLFLLFLLLPNCQFRFSQFSLAIRAMNINCALPALLCDNVAIDNDPCLRPRIHSKRKDSPRKRPGRLPYKGLPFPIAFHG